MRRGIHNADRKVRAAYSVRAARWTNLLAVGRIGVRWRARELRAGGAGAHGEPGERGDGGQHRRQDYV